MSWHSEVAWTYLGSAGEPAAVSGPTCFRVPLLGKAKVAIPLAARAQQQLNGLARQNTDNSDKIRNAAAMKTGPLFEQGENGDVDTQATRVDTDPNAARHDLKSFDFEEDTLP